MYTRSRFSKTKYNNNNNEEEEKKEEKEEEEKEKKNYANRLFSDFDGNSQGFCPLNIMMSIG